ncbi:hypothetical protein HF673_01105 [Acidithiobacillus thiooxidans]|uniref:hypothetical protein n=1 Tax=Acidithiobacillus thiooxidans TaxID=930 RepID=UPI001C077134|nr:hypothetical protein [Acidithiobacillus thiooxidans]MBU2834413.1 hypothetical protein [Acidithiobacillus thiooxidans]
MRDKKNIERMLNNEIKIRLVAGKHFGIANVEPWPFRKTITLHYDWLDEHKATDTELADCLMEQLERRKGWIFTATRLLGYAGSFVMLVAALWNLFIAPFLNMTLGAGLPIDRLWIAYGLVVMVASVLIDSGVEAFRKKLHLHYI